MYFDEALWRRLIEFAKEYEPHGEVTVTDWRMRPGTNEVALDDYMLAWENWSDDDRSRPPAFVMVRHDRAMSLLMVTEYWVDVGGPYPYADLYTYSLFSNRELGSDIRRFLADASAASQWNMATDVLKAA